MRKTLLIVLFTALVSGAWGQPGKPADFTHVVGQLRVLASPVNGGKQVLVTANPSGEITIKGMDYVKYNTSIFSFDTVYRPFSDTAIFHVVVPGNVPEGGNIGSEVEIQLACCLVLVPVGAEGVNSAPIIKDGMGVQSRMKKRGNWWYIYAKWGKIGQKFTVNPTNGYNMDQEFWPANNTVVIASPKRDVTINAVIK